MSHPNVDSLPDDLYDTPESWDTQQCLPGGVGAAGAGEGAKEAGGGLGGGRRDIVHPHLYEATPDHSILKNGLAKSTSRYSLQSSVYGTLCDLYSVSVLGRDEGYTVKYNPLPEGVPKGEARGNS